MNPDRKSLYGTWKNMRRRCQNPKDISYRNYGARGISVCSLWDNSFEEFYQWAMSNGWAFGLTIERERPNGNYEPSNCKWVDMSHQLANRRPRSSKSPYVGVDQLPQGTWRAKIKYRGVVTYLGVHPTAEQAADARDAFIKQNNLPHTRSR